MTASEKMPNVDAKYYTTKQVAEALQVSEAAVRRAVARGAVPSRRLSPRGPIRIPESYLFEPLPTSSHKDDQFEDDR